MTLKRLILEGLLLISSTILFADIGHFDIYRISLKGKECYIALESPGILKNNDLCYYDFDGNYKMEVKEYIDKSLKRSITVITYANIEKIILDSLNIKDGMSPELESPIWILKGWQEISRDSLLGKYELLDAVKGHTFGLESSENLSESDNTWINRSTMTNIFSIDNGECVYNFYSSVLKSQGTTAQNIRYELQGLLPNREGELDSDIEAAREKQFRRRIEELVEEKILMIGGCSC